MISAMKDSFLVSYEFIKDLEYGNKNIAILSCDRAISIRNQCESERAKTLSLSVSSLYYSILLLVIRLYYTGRSLKSRRINQIIMVNPSCSNIYYIFRFPVF